MASSVLVAKQKRQQTQRVDLLPRFKAVRYGFSDAQAGMEFLFENTIP